jgi:hypothetical protein
VATKYNKIFSGYQPRQLVEWRKNQRFEDHFRPRPQGTEVSTEVSIEVSIEVSTEVSAEVSTEVSIEVSTEVSIEFSTEVSTQRTRTEMVFELLVFFAIQPIDAADSPRRFYYRQTTILRFFIY